MNSTEIILRLLAAMGAGLTLGVERTIAHKIAGMRTYALVSIGAATFVLVSELMRPIFIHYNGFNPIMPAAYIITGVGFLGGGLMIARASKVNGLTTAAGLWIAASLGVAAGFGLFGLVAITTALTLFTFTILWYLEHWVASFIAESTDQDTHGQ